ncbi:MAG: ribosome biogenesis GTP-binding protein YihA/YsxC [Bacteriovoracaceae bacterium]|jgi:GTP-binding protein|nr:ribosome biogenesis GTP-binding protein YihA/YsxC [Bacteriovoracaceae bacterium]
MDKQEVNKGSTKFIRAFDNVDQIYDWWDNHPDAIGIAFVGRSNVGKSSLINTLFGNKTAKTSKTPGRTQKINIFTFELTKDEEKKTYYLYDLPGYGHAQVNKSMSKNWKAVMGAFFEAINSRTLLINLQDARHPNQKVDQQFYEYINTKLIDVFLVFNKLDKLKRQKERAHLNKLKPQIIKDFKTVKNIFFVSAEKKEGVPPLELAMISFLLKPREI